MEQKAAILIVDDDSTTRILVSETLRVAGYSTYEASSAEQAKLVVASMPFAAIVLDVMMPDTDGLTFLRSLRMDSGNRRIPVILLSARSGAQERVDGLELGADDYLTKPFAPRELVLRVQRLVGQRASEPPPTSMTMVLDEVARLEEGLPATPLRLGRYELCGVIATGGMGLVLRGFDPFLRRTVALKTLRLPQVEARYLAALIAEAVIGSRFNDPNIVTVYDAGELTDGAFVAMELVDGLDLETYGALGHPLDVVPLAAAVSHGLAVAHAHGVVHRDIKPGNILLGRDGSIKIGDFGLARLVESLEHEPNTVMGTPGFMPPEVFQGEACGAPGDVFALGVALYRASTGYLPFRGETLPEIIQATLGGCFVPARTIIDELPGDFDELLCSMLAPDPAQRPPASAVAATASHIAARLGRAWYFAPSPWLTGGLASDASATRPMRFPLVPKGPGTGGRP